MNKYEVNEPNLIDGQELGEVNTLKSWYDNNCVAVNWGNEWLRISGKQLGRILNECQFRTIKKKKYTYLEPVSTYCPVCGGFNSIEV